MGAGWIVFLVGVAAVGLFVLGMSLTQLFKGHPIDSEIGTNAHMRERGIRCTAGEFRRQERASSRVQRAGKGCAQQTDCPAPGDAAEDCASCHAAAKSPGT